MLLLIILIFTSNSHFQVSQACSNENIVQETQNSTFSQFELAFKKHEQFSLGLASTDIITRFGKYMRNILFGNTQGDGKGFEMSSKFTRYVDINNISFANEGVEFDLRRREDAYRMSDPKEFPYAVGLIIISTKPYSFKDMTGGISTCSASLLTGKWVLTAAHCVDTHPEEVLVYAGGRSLNEVFEESKKGTPLPASAQLRTCKTFYIDNNSNDVALIEVSEAFNLTDTVNTIKLSNKPWNYRGYRKCVTTAFGRVQYGDDTNPDNYKRKTQELDVKKPCLCSPWVKSQIARKNYRQDTDFMCSKPREDFGVCSGDSGGALVCDHLVVGVNMAVIEFYDINYCDQNIARFFFYVLFGLIKNLNPRCGGKNTLSTFQAICPSLPWINEHVKLFSNDDLSECRKRASLGTKITACNWIVTTSLLIQFQFLPLQRFLFSLTFKTR